MDVCVEGVYGCKCVWRGECMDVSVWVGGYGCECVCVGGGGYGCECVWREAGCMDVSVCGGGVPVEGVYGCECVWRGGVWM